MRVVKALVLLDVVIGRSTDSDESDGIEIALLDDREARNGVGFETGTELVIETRSLFIVEFVVFAGVVVVVIVVVVVVTDVPGLLIMVVLMLLRLLVVFEGDDEEVNEAGVVEAK